MDKHSPFCLIKPLRKSCRIDRYEHGERSMLVFISTVTSMENDRYETTFSRFYPINSLFQKNHSLGLEYY